MVKDDTPEISILVANFNGASIIERCLASIYDQDFGVQFEVLVHDDASADASCQIIRTHFPQVRLIESEENVGFCRSNNRLADCAKGRFFLLLNNDAWLDPSTLESLYTAALKARGPQVLSLPQIDADTGELIDRGCAVDPFFNPIPVTNHTRRHVAYAIGALLWVPAEVWRNIGGFPEWLGSIGEDLYLCQAAYRIGVPTRVLNKPGYYHHVGHSFGGGKVLEGRLASTYRRRYLSERNKTLVLVTMAPALYSIFIIPLHLVLLFIEGAFLSLFKCNRYPVTKIYFPAVRDFFRLLPQALAARRKLCRIAATLNNDALSQSFLAQINWVPRKLVLLFRFGIPGLRL